MALSGKLIGYVEISKKGDVFHNLLRHTPNEIAKISPQKIHGCDLLDGDRGAVGSVVYWHYTIEGKRKYAKEIIESVNEENHTIVLKVIEGELVEELYKTMRATFHVEEKGDGQVATWTIEFEKPDPSVRYPTYELDFICDITRELDAHDNTN